jgi:hypothetical protein
VSFDRSFASFRSDLGPASEEIRELLRRPFETDEYRTAQLELQAQQLDLLYQLAANTGGVPAPETPSVGDDLPGDDGDTARPEEPSYFATSTPITVDSTQFEVTEWGFSARSVVLIFDAPVEIAFADPTEENTVIPLDVTESPFSIAGVDGLFASRVHYRVPVPDDPAADPAPASLRIIAVE